MIIKVNGKEYETAFDSEGVQRFKKNSTICFLVDSGQVNLNKLSIYCYLYDKFSYIDYMEFIMQTGYSVSGFADLFPDAEIENPLWESKK